MSDDAWRPAIARAAAALTSCRRLLVLAGAGLSADAGIPTFRGSGGLWRNYPVEELATPEGFAQDPELVWDWYRERRLQIAASQPHVGQRALTLLQQHFPAGQVLVATTNEDDLLERAGVNEVVHLHGEIFLTRCTTCSWQGDDRLDNALSFLPCPRCGARVRPGSVWYGEAVPIAALQRVAGFDPDGCLVVGSSCLVQPVASIPLELRLHGHPVVEINPEATPLSELVTCSIRALAKDALPVLVDLLTSATVREQARRVT
ncbi:MAG: NAD-dependent deacylase [Planctomycetes bacterium]|nr:NAD-dependent deacylase [Planctomycetota bacterium]